MTRVRFWMAPLLALAVAASVGLSRAAAQNDSKQPAEQKQAEQKQADQGAKQSDSGQSQQQSGSNQTGSNQSGSNQPTSNQNKQPAQQDGKSGQGQQGQSQSNQQQPANRDTQAGSNQQKQSGSNQPAGAGQAPNRGNQQPNNRDNQSRDNNIRQTNISVGIQFGTVNNRGLVINTVQNNSFFFRAGLRQGDVIVSFGGRPIRNHTEFIEYITVRPGERIPVIIIRDGREETVYIVYEENLVPPQQPGMGGDQGAALLGVTFDTQIPQAAVIKEVVPGGAAAAAGLKAGDEIIALNGQRVTGLQNTLQVVGALKAGDRLEIDYLQLKHAQVTLAPGGQRTAEVGVNPGVQQTGFQQNVQAQGNQNAGQNQDNRTPQGNRNPNQNTGKSPIVPRIR